MLTQDQRQELTIEDLEITDMFNRPLEELALRVLEELKVRAMANPWGPYDHIKDYDPRIPYEECSLELQAEIKEAYGHMEDEHQYISAIEDMIVVLCPKAAQQREEELGNT